MLRLGSKLGPILWQFPPRMKFDPERFRTFLELLPKTPTEKVMKQELRKTRPGAEIFDRGPTGRVARA